MNQSEELTAWSNHVDTLCKHAKTLIEVEQQLLRLRLTRVDHGGPQEWNLLLNQALRIVAALLDITYKERMAK